MQRDKSRIGGVETAPPVASLPACTSASASLVVLCSYFFAPQELVDLTKNAIASSLTSDALALWSALELAMDPGSFEETHTFDQIRSAILAPDGDLAGKLNTICPDLDRLDRIRIANLGVDYQAGEKDWIHSGGPGGIIRAAINRRSASTDREAGKYLRILKDAVDPTWKLILAHASAEHRHTPRITRREKPPDRSQAS